MTITFFTNFIHHHQVHVADELYKILGGDYTFVTTDPLSDALKRGGYGDFTDRPYLLESFASEENYKKAIELGLSSDIVIIGSAPDIFIIERLKQNKHTFRYSERWFKKIFCRAYLNPRYWAHMLKNHTFYRNDNLYMLCASAFTSKDASRIFAYPNKCYKWGYFTNIDAIDIKQAVETKRGGKIKILWCARFLKWKHPELPVLLAQKLKMAGYNDFEINMLGSGEEYEKTVLLSKKMNVDNFVNFVGSKPNEEVLGMMRNHDIFLFTSDRGEGWGAVLNEAMSNGCTVVASDEIGAVPFLVENGKNGLMFKSKNIDSLFFCVKKLIDDIELREKLAIEGYFAMKNVWSPENAANNFIKLASSKLNNSNCKIMSGPCSFADK